MKQYEISSKQEVITSLVASAPRFQSADNLLHYETWMRRVSKELDEADIAEAGCVAIRLVWIQLMVSGPLTRKENGNNWPYRDRIEYARKLQEEVILILNEAKNRVNMRYQKFSMLAQSAIRASANAKILAAPGDQNRMEWLQNMINRMSCHPDSAAFITMLALQVSDNEILQILDSVLFLKFGV